MAEERTFRAVHRRAPMSPSKARYVVDLIKGKSVNDALDTLRFCPKRAAPMLSKVVMSALASAQLDPDCDHNRLHVVDARADDGPTLKRWKTRSRGQMFPRLSRYAHLTIVLAEREPAERRRARRAGERGRRARVEASRRAGRGGGEESAPDMELGASEENQIRNRPEAAQGAEKAEE